MQNCSKLKKQEEALQCNMLNRHCIIEQRLRLREMLLSFRGPLAQPDAISLLWSFMCMILALELNEAAFLSSGSIDIDKILVFILNFSR